MAVEKDLTIEKETLKQRPNFDYFSASNFKKMQNNTETAEKELNRFKNDYSASKLNQVYEKYNMFDETEEMVEPLELEEEEEVATSPKKDADFQKLIRDQNKLEEVEDTLTYQKIERNPKVKLNLSSKTRLSIFTYVFVSLMLGVLLIYNAFSIGNLNTNINTLNNNIASEQINIERVIKDIGNMTDEDNVLDVATDLSFSQIPVENIVTVSLYDKQTPVTYQGQTNWFDSICKFFNNLFGG